MTGQNRGGSSTAKHEWSGPGELGGAAEGPLACATGWRITRRLVLAVAEGWARRAPTWNHQILLRTRVLEEKEAAGEAERKPANWKQTSCCGIYEALRQGQTQRGRACLTAHGGREGLSCGLGAHLHCLCNAAFRWNTFSQQGQFSSGSWPHNHLLLNLF